MGFVEREGTPRSSGLMDQEFPNPDEIFEDRYRIVSEIDRGGFGRVYLAQQLELNRDVAIKVLQPVRREGVDETQEAQRLEIIAKRFTREAQLVSQLRDSHTVTMYDYGTTDDGLLYMVLEYVHGEPLNRLVEQHGAFTPERAVKITMQILSSLEEAHALGMLHRDIKPANVMLFDHAGRTDQVKVLDFGLAKSVESGEFTADDPDLTGDEVILGTPRYMSPEQIRGESLDARTDIYSLGLVLFEMLAGYKAVGGDSTMQTLARHLNNVPICLPADLDVPEGLRHIVDRMLLKNPEQRFVSARELVDALNGWRDYTPPDGLEFDSGSAEVRTYVRNDEERQRRLMIGIGGVMALFLVIAIISAFAGSDDAQAVAETEQPETAETAETTETPDAGATTVNTKPVVAEVRTEEPEPERIEPPSDDEPSTDRDPFARAGVDEEVAGAKTETDVPKESEPAETDAEPEVAEPVEKKKETTKEPPPDPPRTKKRTRRKRSTKRHKSGKKKENKLKLRVLQ
jgi:hypothetical protein